jgi:hypothetical protein
LPASAVTQECPNQRGLTQDEALIEAIKGEPDGVEQSTPQPEEAR